MENIRDARERAMRRLRRAIETGMSDRSRLKAMMADCTFYGASETEVRILVYTALRKKPDDNE